MYFHHFRHLGRHLEFLKMLNDDRLSSSRILNGNVLPLRIFQEKNLLYPTSRSIENMLYSYRTIGIDSQIRLFAYDCVKLEQ